MLWPYNLRVPNSGTIKPIVSEGCGKKWSGITICQREELQKHRDISFGRSERRCSSVTVYQ